jgi:thioredoxin 1
VRGLLATLVVLLVLTGCENAPTPLEPRPFLLAFHATWCQPCQRDRPLLDEVRLEFPTADYDADRDYAVFALYHVNALPTYIVEYKGREVLRTGDVRTAIQTLHCINQQQ